MAGRGQARRSAVCPLRAALDPSDRHRVDATRRIGSRASRARHRPGSTGQAGGRRPGARAAMISKSADRRRTTELRSGGSRPARGYQRRVANWPLHDRRWRRSGRVDTRRRTRCVRCASFTAWSRRRLFCFQLSDPPSGPPTSSPSPSGRGLSDPGAWFVACRYFSCRHASSLRRSSCLRPARW